MASPVLGKALRITSGNVRNNHIPVTYVRDLFPADAFGGSSERTAGNSVKVMLDGVGTFETDIAGDKNILRIRQADAIERFYALHKATDGTRIFFEKTGPREFRLTVI